MQTLAPDSFCHLTNPQPYQRERGKPQLALNNFTAGVRKREDANRTREAGLDEIQGVVANTLDLFRIGSVRCHEGLHRVPGSVTKRGNPRLRAALVECACPESLRGSNRSMRR